jgi:sugar phosphate isomerase/epimerase
MISFPTSFTVISDEVSQDPIAVAAFARRHGLGGIELRSMFGRAFRDLTKSDISEIAQVLADEGLRVFGCATPVFKCPLQDVAQRAEHRDVFLRSVEVAGALDCPLLRVFTFLRAADRTTDADLNRAGEGVRALAELAPATIKIGVENEASCLMGTAAECATFFREAGDPRLSLIWDPCNVLYVPGYTGAATADFSTISRWVSHIHVKDAVRKPAGPEACVVGEGDVGWADHFRAIDASGYDQKLSLETHWRMKALARDALHLPAGFGFSAGGEAASAACFHAIAQRFNS